jgi:triosephosphate isomerase
MRSNCLIPIIATLVATCTISKLIYSYNTHVLCNGSIISCERSRLFVVASLSGLFVGGIIYHVK